VRLGAVWFLPSPDRSLPRRSDALLGGRVSKMNLKELSQHLGLSQTTVSRALNGFPEVNEATRRRVQEAAAQFGYAPNASARRLATGRLGAIGVVTSPESRSFDPFFALFLAGLAEGVARDDADVVLYSAPQSEELGYRRFARIKTVDAVVLTSMEVDDRRVRLLSHLGLPVVTHGRTAGSIPHAFLDVDHAGAVMRATELLFGLGHARVALLGGDPRRTFSDQRRCGWQAAHAQAGTTASPALALDGLAGEEAGYRAARRLLEGGDAPTAFVCADLFVAAGAMLATRDLGLEVGGEVSIVAHDDGLDVLRAEGCRPALTTTHSSLRAAGVRVAELASELIGGGDPTELQEVWSVDLIFRASTRPPRRRR
jgi:LacI family transcriptional regulator